MASVRRLRFWLWGALVISLLAAVVWRPFGRYRRAFDFLTTLARAGRSEVPRNEVAIAGDELTLHGTSGPIRARLYYRVDRPHGPGVVVAHGVHYQGIDERRLVPFARSLAREGLVVLTPELSDLADYRVTAQGIGVIDDAVRYLASRRDHVQGARVGLLGFSFAGGLALVAAASPALRGELSFVTSVGGYQDLSRVLRFLIHDEIATPHGVLHRKAHEYGLVVLVHQNLEHFVPPADVPVLHAAFKAWLKEDRPRARALASERTTAEAERLWSLLERGELQTLGPELDALLAAQRNALSSLSPRGHLKEIDVPVYLLHGAHDAVIPNWATSSSRTRRTSRSSLPCSSTSKSTAPRACATSSTCSSSCRVYSEATRSSANIELSFMASLPAAKSAATTRWPIAALAVIVIVSLAFRVYVSNHCSLWLDEVWTLHDTEVSWLELLRGASREHPPLMYWFVRASLALFGTSELALRLPSLLFGCGLLLSVYFLCLELELRPAGALVAVAWLALSPFFLRHATEARHYAMFPALTVLATLFTLRLLRRPHDFSAFVGFAVSAAAAAATQYFGLAYVAALVGVLAWQRLVSWRRGEFSWRMSRRVAVVGAVCAAVYLIIVIQALGLAHFYAHHQTGPRTGRLDLGLLNEFSFLRQSPLAIKIEPFVAAVGLIIVGFRLRGIARIVPLALAFAPCAGAFLISSGHRVMPRYLAPSFVFYQLGTAVFVIELAGLIAGRGRGFTVFRVVRALPAALLLLLPFVVRLREYPTGYGAGLDYYAGLQSYLKWHHDDTALVVYPRFPGEFIVRIGYPVAVPLQSLEDFKPIPGVHHYVVAEFERPGARRDFGEELTEHFGLSKRRLRTVRPVPLPKSKFQPPVRARLLTIED